MNRIFIGGLGRSGTTIALNALHRHRDVYAVPLETKFLVEEDSFADLIRALTDDFSIAGAPVALARFEDLMRRQVRGLAGGKFTQQHTLSSDVFPDYDAALEVVMSLLRGRCYFPDRAPLLAATRHFVAATFEREALRSGRTVWAEKTPSNIWRVPFLRELWPDCRIVHMIRAPRAILLSLVERGWLPAEPAEALSLFDGYLTALLRVRRSRLGDPRCVEIRLEDLVADTPGTLDVLARSLDLAPFDAEAVAGVMRSIDRYQRAKPPPARTWSAADLAAIDERPRPAAFELHYFGDGS